MKSYIPFFLYLLLPAIAVCQLKVKEKVTNGLIEVQDEELSIQSEIIKNSEIKATGTITILNDGKNQGVLTIINSALICKTLIVKSSIGKIIVKGSSSIECDELIFETGTEFIYKKSPFFKRGSLVVEYQTIELPVNTNVQVETKNSVELFFLKRK